MRREMIVEDDRIVDLAEAPMAELHAVADTCKALHNEGLTGDGDMKVLAHIPDIVVEKWLNDHGITFAEFMRSKEVRAKMLNDPDLSAFRVWKGHV
jgi:hypothetical protein